MYILATGCSWSDPKFQSWSDPKMDCNWKKWPAIVGDYYGVQVRNVARSGSSIKHSFDQILDHVLSDHPPKAIIWQLTEWIRYNWLDRQMISPTWHFKGLGLKIGDSTQDKELRSKNKSIFDIPFYKFDLDLLEIIQGPNGVKKLLTDSLKMIYYVLEICTIKNIPILIFQSDVKPVNTSGTQMRALSKLLKEEMIKDEILDAYVNRLSIYDNISNHFKDLIHFYDNKCVKYILEDKYFRLIDSKYSSSIFGWPILTEFGGSIIGHEGNYVNSTDFHPNGEGQKRMAHSIIQELEMRKWSFKEQ